TGAPFDLYLSSTAALRKNHANDYLNAASHELTYRIVGAVKNALSSGIDINDAAVLAAALATPAHIVPVTLNTNTAGSDDGSTHYVAAGGLLGALATPLAREGYAFAGWNTAANGTGTTVTSNTAVTANVTLWAQWRKLGELVYFVDAGDINPATL